MYGVEYEQPIGDNDDDDVTCAVCYVSTRETELMLPAKTSCPDTWTREYYGYLMSGPIGNSGRSSFIYYVLIEHMNRYLAVKGREMLAT